MSLLAPTSSVQHLPHDLPFVDRAQVRDFVTTFYQQIQQDELLGPIFNRVIADENWAHHYEVMTDFWCAVAFDGPSFHGHPMLKHARIRGISAQHFQQWLSIFDRTCAAFWPVTVASVLQKRAHQIADSLLIGTERMRERGLITEEQWV